MFNNELEQIEIPNNIDDFIDNGINRIKEEKFKSKKKPILKLCMIISLSFIFISGLFLNSTLANASDTNIFKSIFKFFEDKSPSNSKLSNIENNINKTVQSDNISITIDSVACDNNYISIAYKVINYNSFNLTQNDIHKIFLNGSIKNLYNERITNTFSEKSTLIDDNTLLVIEKYTASDLFDSIIPDEEFTLEININSIDISKNIDGVQSGINPTEKFNGNWSFNIPIKKNLSQSTSLHVDGIITAGTKIEYAEATPYELRITINRDSSLPKAVIIFKDNNGNIIDTISGNRVDDETFMQILKLPNSSTEFIVGYINWVDTVHSDLCNNCNSDGTHSYEIEMEEKLFLN